MRVELKTLQVWHVGLELNPINYFSNYEENFESVVA
jgi:hypothetical protein